MNAIKTRSLLAAITLSLALPAVAQTATPKLDQREARQQRRIDQGVSSGQLNSKEAARLEKRADRLDTAEAKAKADGVVTKGERARLQRKADHNSRAIAREKHDNQVAK
jgi:hypothetical protein